MLTRFLVLFALAVAALAQTPACITHGPILGRLGTDHIGVWALTERPAAFCVRYGLEPGRLNGLSSPVTMRHGHDI